ncbi:hypothetical protein CIB48_g8197 [Xylaria polymorpha]|nr:hypothetical protein CIB48_g8197 [Xylaria polymorpha]
MSYNITEKPEVVEVDETQHGIQEDVIGRIDAMASETTFESFAHLDEKKILRKMDMRLIPMLALLYLLAFLDRGNIGNAKIEGLQEDLKITNDQYNLCLTVFFFSYAAFEVPSNLLLKRLRPSRWLPIIMIGWGTVMTLMGIVQNFQGLLSARFFLGVAEAGLYPGYCRREIQLRQAMFFSAASIAGAFSGLLAFAIAKVDGLGGLEGWRWIFILEGLATVVVAVASFFLLYDFPETATFLTEEERAFVIFRLKYQGQTENKDERSARVAEADEFEWKYVWAAFKDWQIWVNIFVYWGIVCPLYGVSLFLPTIIKSLGYVSSTAQLLTVPIYVTAAILAIVVAYFSDRVGKRSPFVVVCMLAILLGFILCISTSKPGVVSAGMAIQIGAGNLGGAFASNFYRQKDAPRYILGHALELAFTSVGLIAAAILILNYMRINRSRAKAIREGAHNQFTPEELSAMGDRAVTFRYVY